MAYTIEWDVQPKEIDASANEIELDDYTATNTYTGMTEERASIATAKSITPKYCETMVAIEIISDQPVTVVVNTTVITLTGIHNVLINLHTALTVTALTISNASGNTADVLVRTWGTVTVA